MSVTPALTGERYLTQAPVKKPVAKAPPKKSEVEVKEEAKSEAAQEAEAEAIINQIKAAAADIKGGNIEAAVDEAL